MKKKILSKGREASTLLYGVSNKNKLDYPLRKSIFSREAACGSSWHSVLMRKELPSSAVLYVAYMNAQQEAYG